MLKPWIWASIAAAGVMGAGAIDSNQTQRTQDIQPTYYSAQYNSDTNGNSWNSDTNYSNSNVDNFNAVNSDEFDRSSELSNQTQRKNSYGTTYVTYPTGYSTSYTHIGDSTYGSDGSTYTQIGSTGYANSASGNTTSYTNIGNTTYGSDGSTYTQIGNTVYGNDGQGNSATYTQIGNTTYGSDGSSYTQIGNTGYANY